MPRNNYKRNITYATFPQHCQHGKRPMLNLPWTALNGYGREWKNDLAYNSD